MDSSTVVYILMALAGLFFVLALSKAFVLWLFDIEKGHKLLQEQNELLREITSLLSTQNSK